MEQGRFIRKKVYDPLLRWIHLILGLSTLTLIATGVLGASTEPGGRQALIWDLHVEVGYIFIGALIGRIVWFMIGPSEARFSALVHPTAWKQILKTRKHPPLTQKFGHDPTASLAYLGFYAGAVVMALSGLLLAGIEKAQGPLSSWFFDENQWTEPGLTLHLLLSIAIAGFIVAHLSALIYHEIKNQLPLTQAMISGFQYRQQPKENPDAKT